MARMELALDTNTSIFSDGIKMLEVRQQVTFRIMQDVFNGQVRVKDVVTNEDGLARATVDVNGYLQDYLAELAKHEEAPKQEEKAGPGPILSTPDDEAPTIFGGDGP